MNEETHKLLLAMGFLQLDTDARDGGPRYQHTKHGFVLAFPCVGDVELGHLADLMFKAGAEAQQRATREVIRDAAQKLGFKL